MSTSIELRTRQVASMRTSERRADAGVFDVPTGVYAYAKPVCDFVAAVVLLALLSPIMLLAACAIKLTSSGPVFYRQNRSGLLGRTFRVWKFRTMVDNAEAGTGPVWSTSGDPRITAIGKILRDTHIDEFPQLFNVLTGSMSLVGPRPERPEIVKELEDEIPAYSLRLAVRPGITGFAQVRLPPDSDLAGVRRKLAYDLYYIRHVGPLMDVKIMLRTGVNFIWSVGDVTITNARLPRDEVVERFLPYILDEHSARETFAAPSQRFQMEARRAHENSQAAATAVLSD